MDLVSSGGGRPAGGGPDHAPNLCAAAAGLGRLDERRERRVGVSCGFEVEPVAILFRTTLLIDGEWANVMSMARKVHDSGSAEADGTDPLARAQAALLEASRGVDEAVAAARARDEARRAVADQFDNVSEEAARAFLETVSATLRNRPLTVEAARRGALLAVAADVWEDELGPLLTTVQVGELLGGISRQRVDERLREQALIGLRDNAGRLQFPSFQFVDGRPVASMVEAFWIVADGAGDGWVAASWCVTTDEALGGVSPVAWVRHGGDPERLATVARQDAARFAR